jgi:hypothetical protein
MRERRINWLLRCTIIGLLFSGGLENPEELRRELSRLDSQSTLRSLRAQVKYERIRDDVKLLAQKPRLQGVPYTKYIIYPDYISYLTYMPEQRTLSLPGNNCIGRRHSETVSLQRQLLTG